MNLPLPVRLVSSQDQWNGGTFGDYTMVVRGRSIVFTGTNLLAFHLVTPGKEDGRSYGKALFNSLNTFPGMEIDRLDGARGITNLETIRIRTTLNHDVFTDLDVLYKLQNCKGKASAKKVASKINQMIAEDGVDSLPNELGRGLLD